MTNRQREKKLKELAVLFEKEVQDGTYLDGEKITFEEFINKWTLDYAEKQLAPKTVQRYKELLKRINIGIGHIKLSKLQPHHLVEFYNNLAEGGIRLDYKYHISEECAPLLITNKKSIADKGVLNTRTISEIVSAAASLDNLLNENDYNISNSN